MLLFVLIYLSTANLNVAMWNIVQQPWLDTPDNDIIEQIRDQDLDILLLVEVWSSSVRDTIITNTKDMFPFSYYPQERREAGKCDAGTSYWLDWFQYCLEESTMDSYQLIQPTTGHIPTKCIYIMAVAIYSGSSISDSSNSIWRCLSCLVSTMMYHDINTSISMCKSGQGEHYGYNGSSGILILSKHPIQQVEETRFTSLVANRVNVKAHIQEIYFGFSHFAFNILEDYSSLLTHLSYGDTQLQQAQDLIGVDVILGDLNSGPDYQPDGYNMLLACGYQSVFGSVLPKTYCPDPSIPLCNGKQPSSIDHILVRGNTNDYSMSDTRIIIGTGNAELFGDHTMVSDHVGIKAALYTINGGP